MGCIWPPRVYPISDWLPFAMVSSFNHSHGSRKDGPSHLILAGWITPRISIMGQNCKGVGYGDWGGDRDDERHRGDHGSRILVGWMGSGNSNKTQSAILGRCIWGGDRTATYSERYRSLLVLAGRIQAGLESILGEHGGAMGYRQWYRDRKVERPYQVPYGHFILARRIQTGIGIT